MLTQAIPDTWSLTSNSEVGDIWTDTRDFGVGRAIRERGVWAEGESIYLKAIVKPGMHVVDVGANVGYLSRLCSMLVGSEGKVTAIEADPDTAALLQMNADCAQIQNITVLPVAVGAERGEITIWRHPDGNLGGNRSVPFDRDAGSETIPCWRLDDLFGDGDRIHVVKVDIEGMDHQAILGMREIYQRWRPSILAEFNVAAMRAMGLNAADVLREYQANGFFPRLLAADAQLLTQHLGVEMAAMLGPAMLVSGHEDEVTELVSRVDLINLVM